MGAATVYLTNGHLQSGSNEMSGSHSGGRVPWRYLMPWCMVLLQSLVIILLLLDPKGPLPCTLLAHPSRCDPKMCAFHYQTGLAAHRLHDEEDADKSDAWTRMVVDQIEVPSNRSLKSLPVHVPHAPPRVFFNRVPKCGSSAFLDVIIYCNVKNNFTFIRDPMYMQFYMDDAGLRGLVYDFNYRQGPMLYERHFHFVDFVSHGSKPPVYINLLRDPLERLVSWYYFRRYQAGHVRRMATNKRVRTFDECVLGNFSECIEPIGDNAEEGWFKVIPFFCGQDPMCRKPGEEALVQAVRNIKKSYLVVGVTEEYDKFITAIEYMLPDYFRGATHFYKTQEIHLRTKHKTTYKLPVSMEAGNIMRKKMQLEYQLYYFVRQRFLRLYDSIITNIRS